MKQYNPVRRAVVILWAFLAVSCSGLQTGDNSAVPGHGDSRLPRQFAGTFRWEGYDEIQKLVINIYSIQAISGKITATGKGTYNTAGVVTIVDIKISINTETGFFEMWESNPDRDNGFVTQGSHTGSISPDLKRIEAAWTTAGTGTRGRLELTASDPGN